MFIFQVPTCRFSACPERRATATAVTTTRTPATAERDMLSSAGSARIQAPRPSGGRISGGVYTTANGSRVFPDLPEFGDTPAAKLLGLIASGDDAPGGAA